ncbi:regulator of chromosome condensation 1/beta-lactamase-inhibitor protein II [Colletotrichum cereale]|nr:regulator of chromosome condensation 1/beta-lactamase-inhibitor protein II [Colletotrichum cereale]
MKACRTATRYAGASLTARRCAAVARRHASSGPRRPGEKSGFGKTTAFLLTAGIAGGLYYADDHFNGPLKQFFSPEEEKEAEPRKTKYQKAEIEFEKARKEALSKEENRDLISSQHLQVKQSWENPGVYAWGSNVGKVVDPQSKETVVKQPRRIKYFDGKLLRDIKLCQDFGAAVTEKGDLVQWGLGFSNTDPSPVETLKGKDISKIAISNDRIIALSSSGSVYSVPASRSGLASGSKSLQQPQQSSSSSWIPFWSLGASESVKVRDLTPKNLGWGEKITDISSGLQHSLLLSSKGRVFSAAASTAEFPSKGQMGVPGLSWTSRPAGPYDQPHEITGLSGFNVAKIAAGDFHSAVLTTDGKLFTFGDNTYGQLGLPVESTYQKVDAPSLLPTGKLYANTGLIPKITSIAAGGNNTFFTVDATETGNEIACGDLAPARRMPRVTADFWACGQGVYGALGTGKWTHITPGPVKVKALSSLFEFDEMNNRMAPIRLSNVTVGSTHASATMDNVTRTGATTRSSDNDTNWGSDVLFWGGNEHYQLGTGKRSNLNTPSYIGALDGGVGDALMGRAGEVHRFQLTPRQTVRLGKEGKGRKVTLEQKVECGRFVTAAYSAV